jgi:hypothetical protein
MQALAKLPNVHVKLSGLEYVLGGWTADSAKKATVHSLVREVIGMFSPERCMFASNFPVDLHMSRMAGGEVSFTQLYAAFHEIVADLPLRDREALFHGTAERVYKVKI